jgi:fructose-bisphosphate aldolase class 1
LLAWHTHTLSGLHKISLDSGLKEPESYKFHLDYLTNRFPKVEKMTNRFGKMSESLIGRNILRKTGSKMEEIVDALWEYARLCIDWDRVKIGTDILNESTEFIAAEDADVSWVSEMKNLYVRNAIQVGCSSAISAAIRKLTKDPTC